MATLLPEEALRKIALDDSAVSAAFGTRVYPQQAGPNASYPLVIMNRVSSVYEETLAGLDSDNLAHANIQFDIFSKSGYSAVKTDAKKIRNALNAYSGTVTISGDSLNVRRVRLTNELDGFDNPSEGRGDGIHRVIQEYEIWYLDT